MSIRRVAASVAGAVVAIGIETSLPWTEYVPWSTPDEQYAEVVRLAGIPATRVAVSADSIVGTPSVPGQAECAGVSFLWNDGGRQVYVRDPLGTFTGKTHGRYEAATTLPADANQSPYRRRGVSI